MAFAFQQHESVDHAFHRIGRKQLRKAERALRDAEDPNDALHAVRKSAKRVRTLLRVVRSGIAPRRYRELNALVRDAARSLSAGRDAQALVATFDALVTYEGFVGSADVRAELVRRAGQTAESMQTDRAALAAAIDGLAAARALLGRTAVDGNRRVLRAGLRDVYRAAQQGQARCADAAHDDDEAWHEWRKRSKYLWHAVQLVEPASPTILGVGADQLHRLSDALGDDHDLGVLTGLVQEHPWAFGSEPVRDRLFEVVDHARADLHERSRSAGRRLLVETPDAFAHRMVATLRHWDDDELAVGGLTDLVEHAGSGA